MAIEGPLTMENMQVVVDSADHARHDMDVAMHSLVQCVRIQTERGDRAERQTRALISSVRSSVLSLFTPGTEGKYLHAASFEALKDTVERVERALTPRTKLSAEKGLAAFDPELDVNPCPED